jgi:hypothetical protein
MRYRNLSALSAISIALFLAFVPVAHAQSRHSGNDADFVAQPPVVDQSGHREWDWHGGDSLSYTGAGHVRYEPGGARRIIVTGDPDEVANIEVDGGIIREQDNRRDFSFNSARDNRKLEILVQGVTLDHFDLVGSATMDLGRLQRDSLGLRIHGSGKINAAGQARNLSLEVDGSGKANLDQLSVGEADITGTGSGQISMGAISGVAKIRQTGSGRVTAGDVGKNADLTATGSGSITLGRVESISAMLEGSGTVRLVSHPQQSDYHIAGSAKVVMVAPDGTVTELARMRRPGRDHDRNRDGRE